MSSVRLSPRDMWAVQWLCEMRGVPMSVVAELLGTSETNAYRVASRWKAAGLVMSSRTIRPVPGPQWVVPTAETVTSLLGFHAAKWIPGPKDARHLELTARVRIALAGNEACVEDTWISERELRRADTTRSAFGAGERPHLHDGHWTDDLGRLHAIEVELTRKGSSDARVKVRAAYDAAKAAGAASLIYYAASSEVAARVTTAAKAVIRVPIPAGDPEFAVKSLERLLETKKTDLTGPTGLVAAGGAA